MVFGFAMFGLGYAIFYWGLHHMPQYSNQRYSLWALLGFGTLFKNINIPAGPPVAFQKS